MQILLSLTVPGHVIFVAAICSLKSLGFPTVLFFTFYLVAALGQVAVLLYLSHILVYMMWARGTDPDNAAIPYLTAVSLCFAQFLLRERFKNSSSID